MALLLHNIKEVTPMTGKSKFIIFLFLVFLVAAAGCGGSNTSTNYNYSAPATATITIDPSDQAFSPVGGLTSSQHDSFKITVKDANGIPMNNIKITMTFPWATPDSNGANQFVQFYSDGANTIPEPSPFDAVTDKFGVYTLYYTYQLGGGVSYFGNLKVQSGAVVGTAKLTITS
jgi:hypothetical protein